MKKDILTREDIDVIVKSFYDKLLVNPLLSPIFTDVAKIDLEKHLPLIADFWAFLLMNQEGIYSRNVMSPHLSLAKKTTMEKAQFDEWLKLWCETIDELHEGEKAEDAKYRAGNIALMMQHKIKYMI